MNPARLRAAKELAVGYSFTVEEVYRVLTELRDDRALAVEALNIAAQRGLNPASLSEIVKRSREGVNGPATR